MNKYSYKPAVSTYKTFEVDTFWKVYKCARWLGLPRVHSWYLAWTQQEKRNKEIELACWGYEVVVHPITQTKGEQ